MQPVGAGDGGRAIGVETAGVDEALLGELVELDHRVSGGGHHGHRLALFPCPHPRPDDGSFGSGADPAVDAAVPVVQVQHGVVAASQPETGVAFPGVVEPMYAVESRPRPR